MHREQLIQGFNQKLDETKALASKEHRKSQKVMLYIKNFKSDLEEVVSHFQDTDVLKVNSIDVEIHETVL